MSDDKCYSSHAEVPLVNALDECRAELAKLKEGAKVIAEALKRHVRHRDWCATRAGKRCCDCTDGMKVAREHGLLEEK